MTARLHVLDGKCAARLVEVDAAELAELRRSARNATAAYHAGFLDGRDQLADELGVILPHLRAIDARRATKEES